MRSMTETLVGNVPGYLFFPNMGSTYVNPVSIVKEPKSPFNSERGRGLQIRERVREEGAKTQNRINP